MSFSPIEFRFLKTVEDNATDNAKEDHVVTIYRDASYSSPRFLWVFNDGPKNTRQLKYLNSEDEVLESVSGMFNLLAWDTEPYARVQVFAPGFPSPLLRMSDSDRFAPDVLNTLRSVFRSWAESVDPRAARAEVEQFRESSNDDDDDDETAEAEDDDDETVDEGPCAAACPCTPPRRSNAVAPTCPGAPARRAWSSQLDDDEPNCPVTQTYTMRVHRTVTETPDGPRVHLRFE